MNSSDVQNTKVDLFLIGLIALLLVFSYYNSQTQRGIEPKVKSIENVINW